MMGEAKAALSLLNLAGKALSGAGTARNDNASAAKSEADSFAASLDRAQRQNKSASTTPPPPQNAAPKPAEPAAPAPKNASASDAGKPAAQAPAPAAPQPPRDSKNGAADGAAATPAPSTGDGRLAVGDKARAVRPGTAPLVDTTEPRSVTIKDGRKAGPDDAMLAPGTESTTTAALLANVAASLIGDSKTNAAARRGRDASAVDIDDAKALVPGAMTALAELGTAQWATPDSATAAEADGAKPDLGVDDATTARTARRPALADTDTDIDRDSSTTTAASSDVDAALPDSVLAAKSATDAARGETTATGTAFEPNLAGLARHVSGAGGAAHASSGQATAQVHLATPVPDPKFPRALAEQVSLFVAGDIKGANIIVSPPDMGPVKIELTVSGEEARLVFTAAHPDTRQAIEQSSAVLRSMLAERGVSLGQMDVGQGDPQQQAFGKADGSPGNGQGSADGRWSPTGVDRDALTAATQAAIEQAAARRSVNLLDTFA